MVEDNDEVHGSFLALLMAPPDDSPIHNPYHDDHHHHHHTPTTPPHHDDDSHILLPSLFSLENISESSSSHPSHHQPDNYSLNSILEECTKKQRKDNTNKDGVGVRKMSSKARVQEKMYELSKLLPDPAGGKGKKKKKKKKTAEMLEEAAKYVKYLKAQVTALEGMPAQEEGSATTTTTTRQQLLRVVVDTAAVQRVMTERGMCVVSAEQVAHFNRIEMRRRLADRIMAHLIPISSIHPLII